MVLVAKPPITGGVWINLPAVSSLFRWRRIPSYSRKEILDTPSILANRIHDGTPGLSTPPGADERIGSIQRILRLPIPSLD